MKHKKFFERLYKILRVIIIALPILLLLWLINKDLVRGGHLEYVYDLSHEVPVITKLFPENRLSQPERLGQSKIFWQQILQEPVYFEARLPQTFETAEVVVTYQNKNQPLLQLGLDTLGENEWNYYFKPLENQLLDDLDWPKVEGEEGTLWQKEKKFSSVKEFLGAVPGLNNFAAYHFALERKFVIPGYQPTSEITELNKTIRGSHSIYTYIKNEALDFRFIFQDMNRSLGPDDFKIKVYDSSGKKIYEQPVADDGVVTNHDGASKKRQIDLQLKNLTEGVYKIVLDCQDEIFFRKITTRQQYLTFIDRLYLADNIEYSDGMIDLNYSPSVIYSSVPRLGFYTAHPEGLQEVGVGKQSVSISQTHQNFYLTAEQLPVNLYLPKNDLLVFGRGLMALSKETYFNPEIYDLKDLTGFQNIDYLISSYKSPWEENGWKTSSAKFDLLNAKISGRKLRFAISAPELEKYGDQLVISRIKIILDKKPLSLNETLVKILNYLKNKF